MRKSNGFTLLEVLVAMTITALALGSLYGVIAGNKRLALRAEASLARSVAVRSHINYAQLTDEQGDVVVHFGDDKLTLTNGDKFDEPKRKTWTTASDLRGYQIKDANGVLVAEGSYWIREPLPAGANGGQAGTGAALFPGGGAGGAFVPAPGFNGGQPGRNGGPPGRNDGQFPGGNRGRGPGGGQFPGGNGGRFPGGNNGQFPGGNGGQFPGGNGGQFPGGNGTVPPGGRR